MTPDRSALLRRAASTAFRRSAAGVLLAVACGCAQLDGTDETGPDAANPAGAEDIAGAAHGRCWARWDAYRQATNSTFAGAARTPDERQLAHDKADAHLRQLELETRKSVVDLIVQRTLEQKR